MNVPASMMLTVFLIVIATVKAKYKFVTTNVFNSKRNIKFKSISKIYTKLNIGIGRLTIVT